MHLRPYFYKFNGTRQKGNTKVCIFRLAKPSDFVCDDNWAGKLPHRHIQMESGISKY